ncbi:hypothetical protein FRB93_002966 [Tulasnella sp. JGI-2019a]|nr:hypothetical protein FRB93_002966 [Tulasnella sp. JGI-2019a]
MSSLTLARPITSKATVSGFEFPPRRSYADATQKTQADKDYELAVKLGTQEIQGQQRNNDVNNSYTGGNWTQGRSPSPYSNIPGGYEDTGRRSSSRIGQNQIITTAISTISRSWNNKPRAIYFYESTKQYYGFTNFSSHEVRFDGRVYPTSEHLFQSLKFLEHRPLLAEHIRTAGKQPRMAFTEARRFSPETREDWREVSISMMEQVILHKFEQHPILKRELLSTGDAELIEDAGANDAFWGNGADGKGRNELGKALMRLRDHFRTNGRNQR